MLSGMQRSVMSDRSDEVTRSRDTDDLLEETEDLLSESGSGSASFESGDSSETGSRATESRSTSAAKAGTDADAGGLFSGLRSRFSRSTSRPPISEYFAPKLCLAFALLFGFGLFAGGMTIPIAGRVLGLFGVAFALGMVTSKRRYLEVGAAGTTVGGLSAVSGNFYLAMAGSFQTVVAIGIAFSLLACLSGYYFGRDLRDGLFRDVE
ncbi:hypothetical protein SAMN05421809_1938 [Natronorubrum daqingense]|uniref:DUF456 domain-containing protein n=2 Tax=Natronorubrum daqingense TaxID=588898 RepID=A0A1N7CXS5_9EURY|nr:hypothetical protein SAMN05421809_1938 [Natronorubrum daqingense]